MKRRQSPPRPRRADGFSLTELAIVLIIVSLLVGGILVTMSTSRDIADANETQKQLATIADAVQGFAAARGRLPCPATAASNGLEAFCTDGNPANACGATLTAEQAHGRCVAPFTGFLPAATLAISPANAQGLAVDRWNNPIRYAVTTARNNTDINMFTFTAPPSATNGIQGVWTTNPANLVPDLRVCNTAAGIAGGDCANAAATVTDRAVAVIFSTGRNGAAAPNGDDELANWTTSNDRVFVSHLPAQAGGAQGEFDDLVTWLSPHVLYNRLLMAGRIP